MLKTINIFNNKPSLNYRAIELASNYLLQEKVIAIPTDTIYGLAGNANSDAVIKNIYDIKGRHQDKPISICVSEIEDIYHWCDVSISSHLLNQLLPGPVTLVFKRTRSLNVNLNPNASYVGIRIPDHEFVREVIRLVNSKSSNPVAIALTSANISSQLSPISIEEFRNIWESVSAVFDAGRLNDDDSSRLGSTVIKFLNHSSYNVVRKGCAFDFVKSLMDKYSLDEV